MVKREYNMLKHIVMFKLKEGIARDDERVQHAVELIENLPNQINTIVSFELGWDISQKPHSFDYATSWLFHDLAGLEVYNKHPAHLDVLDATREIFEAKIADYFLA